MVTSDHGLTDKQRDAIRALKHSDRIDRMARVMLDQCAAKPGQWISFPECVERTGCTPGQGKADIVKLARENGRLNLSAFYWHFPVELTRIKGIRHYRMNPERAASWSE
jgi:hypothetical protein